MSLRKMLRDRIQVNKSGTWYTLVFAITALDFFMNPFLHFALENTSSRWFIEPCYFEDVCGIYPVIGSPSHNTVRANLEFIYRDLINTISPDSLAQYK